MYAETIQHLARLARLSLTGGERALMAVRLEDISRRLDGLEPPTEPVAPPPAAAGALREDVPVPPAGRAELLANAPQQDGEYFLTPRAIGQEGTA